MLSLSQAIPRFESNSGIRILMLRWWSFEGSTALTGGTSTRRSVERHAWLRYFKFSTTDAVSIADPHLVIRKFFDGEVFSELAESFLDRSS
jgi:hypothetical protein